MKRTLIAGACAVALCIGAAPNAYADTPATGSYWGYSEFGGHVTTGKIDTPDRWNHIVVTTCDTKYRFVNKPISDSGRFSGKRRDGSGNVIFSFVGQFDDPDIAWGYIENASCGGPTAIYWGIQGR